MNEQHPVDSIRIVFLRHAQREHEADEADDHLTSYGRSLTERTAAELRALSIHPGLYLSAKTTPSQETAEILKTKLGPETCVVEELDALTPKPENPLSAVELLTLAGPLASGQTIVCVGHEGRLSRMITLMTGKRLRPLDHVEAVCVEAQSSERLLQGRGTLAWRIPVRAYDEDVLREKVASKMTVATLLAGFSFAALLGVLMDKDFAEALLLDAPPAALKDAVPPAAVLLLTASVALFAAAVYIFDRLGMPPGFWLHSKQGPFEKLPSFVQKKKEYDGLVYGYMIHCWLWVFSPAVFLAGVGLLLVIGHVGGWVLSLLCFAAMVLVAIFYLRVRPKLGVD